MQNEKHLEACLPSSYVTIDVRDLFTFYLHFDFSYFVSILFILFFPLYI